MRRPGIDLGPIANALIIVALIAGIVTLVVTGHGAAVVWVFVLAAVIFVL